MWKSSGLAFRLRIQRDKRKVKTMKRDLNPMFDKTLKIGRKKAKASEVPQVADNRPRINYRYKVMGTLTVVSGGISIRQKIYRVRSMKKLSLDN